MAHMPIAVAGSGMVTSVGLSAAASAAAIRAGLANPQDTRFIDWGGEWIVAHPVPIDIPHGMAKLARMAAMAIDECLSQVEATMRSSVPLILCVAEEDRPGRLAGLDDALFLDIEKELGTHLPDESLVVAQGRAGGLIGLDRARAMIHERAAHAVVVAGVDSYISWQTLSSLENRQRLLTSKHSNGFMPGEAAGAVLVTGLGPEVDLVCTGIGFGEERASIESGLPFRGDGMVQAIRAAAQDADSPVDGFDFRITDLSGEQYYFKEAALAATRLIRTPRESLDLWHAADCIGEVGAAAGPIALGIALAAARKGYAPGASALCHLSNDRGKRAAAFLRGRVDP